MKTNPVLNYASSREDVGEDGKGASLRSTLQTLSKLK